MYLYTTGYLTSSLLCVPVEFAYSYGYDATVIHTYVQHVVQQMLYVRAAGVTRETRTEPSFSFLVLAKAKA